MRRVRSAHSSSATGFQLSAAFLHFADRSYTSYGFIRSVECAHDAHTISLSAPGLSSSGQGRR